MCRSLCSNVACCCYNVQFVTLSVSQFFNSSEIIHLFHMDEGKICDMRTSEMSKIRRSCNMDKMSNDCCRRVHTTLHTQLKLITYTTHVTTIYNCKGFKFLVSSILKMAKITLSSSLTSFCSKSQSVVLHLIRHTHWPTG